MLNTGTFLWRAAEFSAAGKRRKQSGVSVREAKDFTENRTPEGYWSQWMKEAGYETYFAGKWHVTRARPQNLFDHTLHVRAGSAAEEGLRCGVGQNNKVGFYARSQLAQCAYSR